MSIGMRRVRVENTPDDQIVDLVHPVIGASIAMMTDGKSGVGVGLTAQRICASTSVIPDFEPLVGRRILVPQQHKASAPGATASKPQLVQW